MKALTLIFSSILALTALHLAAAEPLIVAHRGSSAQTPENTIPAFQLAWKQGADAIEADFRLTKDGHIVCIHDKDTKYASGKKLIVKKSTLAQLQQLDVGRLRGTQFTGTRIPTIAQVFATVPKGKKIYIEIKTGRVIIPQLIKDIKSSQLTNDQIVIICFNPQVLLDLKTLAPQFKTIWLVSFKKDRNGKMSPRIDVAIKTLRASKADGISTSKNFIGQNFIKHVRSLGFEYHVWTINDIATAKKHSQWGTQSITTDLPGDISKALVPDVPREKNTN